MKQSKTNVSGRGKGFGRSKIISAVVAVVLVVALAVGLMPNDQVYAAEKTSDGNTTGSYAQNLGDNSSTRYAGRVWTDKTVYTKDATFTDDTGNVTVNNDSDFLVAYSALATTQNVTGKSSVPVDVVFVIDNSNSMDAELNNQQTRLEATVAAVNTSIAAVMDSHPDSRVAVVVYGSSAHTLLPLGHYDPMPSGNYISVSGDFSGNNSSYTDFHAVPNHTLNMEGSERGTNIHMGVDAGMDILKRATDIGEGASKHVPALILLSDGAATYAGSGNWWDPSGSQGIGSEASVTFSLETAMHAQYQKQLVNNHYGVEADADTACQIYTIGMGIEQLSGSQRNIARLALNPGTYITENNDEANAMENAWNSYLRGQDPTMRYPSDTFLGWITYSDYTFHHPGSGDISTIAYNDGYYSAEDADDVANVFDDITSDIVSSSAQAPTKIEGGDPLKSGYLTYTDPIGEYLEVKDIKSIIYGGKEFTQKSSSESGNTTTYTFTGEKIESPVYGELDVSSIEISVTKDDNGNETLTVRIPAAAIPLRVNTVDIDENGAIINTNNNAYPARILYTVGAREGVNLETLEGVSDDYISSHLTENGQKVNFYSNKYSGNTQNNKTVGDAKVTFTPAETNTFFYVQEDTPLYRSPDIDKPAYYTVNNDDTLYYFQITYYEGNSEKTEWVSRPGSSFWYDGTTDATLKVLDDGQVAIKQGAPRLGYLDDFAQTKTDNSTGTAEQVFHPVYDGNGQFTVYLGNNGLLQTDAPKSLTVEKEVTTSNSLTAPDADFTFEVTVASKAGTAGDAILTGSDGQPTKTELTFDADGKATFTLKDGQSMEILNIGEGVKYTVKEINLPAGFTSDAADNTKTGTVSGTDENNIVTFTNTYNVTPVTTDDLGISLGGTKSITGRDFQAGDKFVFTIAAAPATPNAPLPADDIDGDGNAITATVEPTSGSEVTFEFGNITFDKPGEYRYVIRENTGELPGVDYDGALYRVNIIVRDNGDGTMSLASTEGGLTGIGGLNYPTNPFFQVWDGEQQGTVVGAVAFENSYSATSAEAVIQGMKELNSTNSDRILADGDFTFKIEALGYNTDGGDQFNQIPSGEPAQPMPANTEVTNIANGNVNFAAMTFTQDMIGNTYGYKITEKLPQGVNADNPTLNGITYDTSEKIVKVTVKRSAEGGEEHVVATVTPNDGTAEAAKNFTFTNKYEPSSVTIGEDTGNAITVQKTFTGRTWNDSDEFKYTLKSIDGAPMPADGDEISIGKPASGNSNTATFGDIKFTKEGVYKYEITETNGGLGGVTYDKHAAKVTVTVTEDTATGTLSAKVEYDNSAAENNSDKAVQNAAAFTNTYKAVFDTDTTVNLNGTKELTGKTLTDSAFYFIVDPQETASGGHAPTGESVVWNPNKADGSIQLLKNVTYTEAGDYVYIIKEQIPSNKEKGMTYDESEYRITVTVTDDQQGNLTASEPKIEKKAAGAADYTEADTVVFENNYEPLSITIAPLEITKVLDGDRNTPLQDGEFSFEMSVVSANPEDGITLPQQTVVENKADGTVPFGDITFTKVGTYKVQVKEVVPDEADKVPGVEYDTHVRTTTFTVTDNAGQLAVHRSGYDGSRTFTNKYTTTGTVEGATDLEVTKNFEGRANDQWLDTDEFTFTLTAGNEDTTNAIGAGKVELPDNAGELKIAADTADHKAAFGNIIFNAPGEYTFKITETKESIPGVDYDGHEATFTVTATDNGDGTLDISTDLNKDDLTFTNTYNPDGASLAGDTALQVTKKVAGAATEEDFNFNLKLTSGNAANVLVGGAEGTAIPDAGIQVSTGEGGFTDGQEKTVSFEALTFTAAGDYIFTVSEVEADEIVPDGWTYDNSDKTITVHVTDEGFDGQLDIAAEGGVEGNNPTFYNTYYKPEDAKSAEDAEGNDISGDMLGVGDELTYTIDWVNNATDENGAPVKATVVVTDTIPARTELVEGSISNGGELAGDTITWTFEDQEPAASGTVSFKVRVTEAAAGTTVINDAEIKIGKNDPKTSTVVNPVPGKQETTNPDEIGEGTVLTYKITFTNTDGDNASAKVVDTLTKGQVYKANSATVKIGDGEATASEPSVTGDAASGQTLTWDLTGLADNAQVTITFDVTITRDAGAEVDNTATVNDHKTNTTTTPYPSDDKKDVTFADEPEISIDGKLVGVGDELTYVIDWAADEEGEVTVTDKIPAGTKLAEGEDAISDGGVEKDGTITWNLGKKNAGDKGTVTFTVVVTDDAVNYDPITNQATIQIGDNDPKTTNKVTTDFPKKEVAAEESDEDGLQVGDTLTYTIEYRNDKDTAATVTVTDVLPDGLTYVDGSASGPEEAAFKAEGQTLTWTIEDAAAGAEGIVTFQAVVNESATVVKDPVTNKATITVGDDEYTTNTTGGDDDVYTGDLTITKEIALTEGQGTEIDADKEFTFTVTLKGTNDEPLTGTYKYTVGEGEAKDLDFDENGQATLTLKHGESAVIADLPEGASYSVAEADYTADGYTPDEGSKAGFVAAGETAKAAFTNTYSASAATGVPAGFDLKKVFEGREWTEDYAFQFKLVPQTEGAPMPKNEAGDTVDTVTVNAPTEADRKTAAFNFGDIEYTKAGTYEYTVTEVHGDNPGIVYSNNEATVKVTVTDKDQSGAATGKLTATATVANSTFTNTYDTGEVDYDAVAEMQIVKNMTGAAIKAGDFTFTMEGKDQASIDKFNGGSPKEFKVTGAALTGNTALETINALTGLKFAKADAGKTYTYTVKENIPDNASNNGDGTWSLDGRTYDGRTYEIAFKVTEDGRGTLSVETFVDRVSQGVVTASRANVRALPVQLVFNNSYNADPVTAGGEGDVEIAASKELTNHPMTGREFTFNVVNTRDTAGRVIISGTNDADGNVVFNGNIEYTTEKLNNDTAARLALRTETEQGTVYEYQYTISEETDGFAGTGFAGVTTSANIVIKVTDNGTGKLSAVVEYPEGDVVFQNTYGAEATVETALKGDKIIRAESGDNPPTNEDIEGRYTFTVTGSDEDGNALPAELMPERTTVTNDASGNVDFGKITYTMEKVFGETGDELASTGDSEDEIDTLDYEQRSKTYTYTIAEADTDPNNPVPGVTNDPVVKTVTVTVTDNGGGTLSISKTQDAGAVSGSDFTFTNIYNIRPTDPSDPSDPAVSGLSFKKIWDVQSGTRKLAAGDFQFVLSDMEGVPVMTGTNDADGNIAMVNVDGVTDGIVFNTPGDFSYVLREVIPDEAVAVEGGMYELDGVTYIPASYNVTAHVTDNGDGTMSVAWSMTDGEGKDVTEAQFVNMYNVDPTSVVLGAGKMLSGRDLKSGEFTFELKNADGNVVSAAKNDENGAVTFEEQLFGNAGEYHFTISEVKGNDKTITYDETVFEVIVKVTDNGDGTLTAEIDNGGKEIVFNNTYTKPAEPQKPEEPGAVQTGDTSSMIPAAAAGMTALIAMAAAVVLRRKKRQ